MKSIIRFIPSDNGIISTIVILAFTFIPSIHCSPPCGLYGAPPCRFLPAPPGQTPACARPGKTYCEHVDNYPTYLIKHLVHKWGYEAKSLIVDETWDDFSSLNWPSAPVFYDPAYIFPHRQQHYKPNHNDFNGYDYDTPHSTGVNPVTNDGTFLLNNQRTTSSPPTYLYYSSANQRHNSNNNNNNNNSPYVNNNSGHKTTPNNPTFWLKRIVRDVSESASNHSIPFSTAASKSKSKSNSNSSKSKSSRDVSLNLDVLEIMGVEKAPASTSRAGRVKRQSPGRTTLCQTTTQFVAPRAALNSRGNWMFVVNEPSTAHQLVKAELCASNTCSNLCELPNGYNSRCEQKFAQKRLVALQANGQDLYTDTFWFPSCCVCTIATN